jgi:hypothetical protein
MQQIDANPERAAGPAGASAVIHVPHAATLILDDVREGGDEQQDHGAVYVGAVFHHIVGNRVTSATCSQLTLAHQF